MVGSAGRTETDPVAAAAELVAATGAAVLPALSVTRSLGVGREEWTRFARHWDRLTPDPYAAELGVPLLRRYGRYLLRDGVLHPMAHRAFAQPDDSNPLYVGQDRDFAPLTDEFARDPLLHKVIRLLSRIAAALDEVGEWNVQVHPFRIRSAPQECGAGGQPTPEGLHRDGITLVSSLLVARRNAIGGESAVYEADGRRLLTATLAEPGTLLVSDDRRTLHQVSPIRPLEGDGPARRDVLVITFASGRP
nr:2OG-Fe dioxygenase family protein [Mycobacterium lepraemurium]